ncbi:hypothetical protein B0J11DRAFT_528770 [Dendryphion nanum]|uniref:Uncharacterized protein n=1 Tax=Dendryphion nanum TaxID=256645 RepID=A0A9P9DTT4_9PLEO|nr:hypothetical protein B0J11DRAFT_528770 [Dendryphion nanum]
MFSTSLTSDPQPLQQFKAKAGRLTSQIPVGSRNPSNAINFSPPVASALPLHVFDWTKPGATEHGDLRSVAALTALDIPPVRVIFAPRDIPIAETVDGLTELFKTYSIPSVFIDESLQNVSQSFGTRKDDAGTEYVWFHLLSKDVAVVTDEKGKRIVNDPSAHGTGAGPAQHTSQANFTWIKPGFVLKIEPRTKPTPPQSRSTTNSSGSTLAMGKAPQNVTLFCFGAPGSLGARFKRLTDLITCDELENDPYYLLDIVLEEMYKLMDQVGWAIADIFGDIESRTLAIASTPGKAGKELDFPGLHNLAKHTIYLRENCESALSTLDDLRTHHNRLMGADPNPVQRSTQQALEYRKTMFQSTERRLDSLDKRMANIIQLSFHLVTMTDSRVMQSENQSMKTIAVMTLIFMPLGTVATIFGTQLIRLRDEAPYQMEVSRDFWYLWLISVPLTVMVVIIWKVWYRDEKKRLIDGIQPHVVEDRRYMGWKGIKETFSKKKNERRKKKDDMS